MAQKFFAAFGNDGIGTIGTRTINSGDMAGILMIAVQALEKRSSEQTEENAKLKAKNADLKAWLGWSRGSESGVRLSHHDFLFRSLRGQVRSLD